MFTSIVVLLFLSLSIALNVLLVIHKRKPEQRSVRSAILSGIQNVNELATVREQFQSIVSSSNSREMMGFKIPGTTSRFIMRYSGMIVCGNDLSKINISERFNVNKVRILVPHSRILDIYADVNTFEVYDQSGGIFRSVKLEDQNREIAADVEEVRKRAIAQGILEHAEKNTKAILTSIVAATGMEADISFVDSSDMFPIDTFIRPESLKIKPQPVEVPVTADKCEG